MALTIKHGSIDQPEANSEMPQCCRLAAAAAAVCLVAGELASERQSVSARATGPGPGPCLSFSFSESIFIDHQASQASLIQVAPFSVGLAESAACDSEFWIIMMVADASSIKLGPT